MGWILCHGEVRTVGRKEGRKALSRLVFVLLWGLAVTMVFGVGCAAPGSMAPSVGPRKVSVEDALQALAAQAQQAVTLRARGQCALTYHVPGEEGFKHNNVTLYPLLFQPPSDMYIQGSIAVESKAVIVGSNREEFWVELRPKEISSYYWGRWEHTPTAEGLMISPGIILEAFGVLGHDDLDPTSWSLTREGAYDVLTRFDVARHVIKRLYVYARDYRVRKIEYLDREGSVVAVAQLGQYRPVTESFFVPTRIRVTTTDRTGQKDTMDIELESLQATELGEQAQRKAFTRDPRDMELFEHVYQLENGHWITER
jgi:hypothetical protein